MAQITNTEANVVIPEIWDQSVLDARYASAVIMSRVLNKTPLVTNKGDIVHIPIRPVVTAGAVTSGGAFTPTALTYTEIQVTINVWQHVSIEVKDDTEQVAMIDLESDLSSQFGDALNVEIEQRLAALDTSVTTNIIGTADVPVNFDDTVALSAFLKLRKLNVPKKDLFFVLNPEAYYNGILLQGRFSDADKSGLAKSIALTGDMTQPIFGAPGYESNNLSTRGNAKAAFLMHREAMAAAFPIQHKTETVRRTSGLILSTVKVMTEFYGVSIGREDHACKIFIKNT